MRRWLRRQRAAYLPDRETKRYRQWMTQRLAVRMRAVHADVAHGLLSVITAVWDGSPADYLRSLYESLAAQNASGATEWVVLDNGCSRPELRVVLEQIRQQRWVLLLRAEQNLGIAAGLRRCLEAAKTRYVLPVDADDELYPDALAVVAEAIAFHNYPKLLFSDEDKTVGGRISQPYFKPDWDPVLLTNSAYIAHLGVVDRATALALGAYSDGAAEGSVDWDLFLRFAAAGHAAAHMREVLYRWRIHLHSTADDGRAKEFIGSSQRAALEGYLARRRLGQQFQVVESELLPGGEHFRLRKTPGEPPENEVDDVIWQPQATAGELCQSVSGGSRPYVCLREAHVTAQRSFDEALGLFRLFEDAAMVGARILDRRGVVVEGGQVFGFSGVCGCPDLGRAAVDPGYFGLALKQRSVDAVSTKMAVVRRPFLMEALQTMPDDVPARHLGAWLGGLAYENRVRVVYTPYWNGESANHASRTPPWPRDEAQRWLARFPALPGLRRYYPAPLSLNKGWRIAD